jgi:hypothetical protein
MSNVAPHPAVEQAVVQVNQAHAVFDAIPHSIDTAKDVIVPNSVSVSDALELVRQATRRALALRDDILDPANSQLKDVPVELQCAIGEWRGTWRGGYRWADKADKCPPIKEIIPFGQGTLSSTRADGKIMIHRDLNITSWPRVPVGNCTIELYDANADAGDSATPSKIVVGTYAKTTQAWFKCFPQESAEERFASGVRLAYRATNRGTHHMLAWDERVVFGADTMPVHVSALRIDTATGGQTAAMLSFVDAPPIATNAATTATHPAHPSRTAVSREALPTPFEGGGTTEVTLSITWRAGGPYRPRIGLMHASRATWRADPSAQPRRNIESLLCDWVHVVGETKDGQASTPTQFVAAAAGKNLVGTGRGGQSAKEVAGTVASGIPTAGTALLRIVLRAGKADVEVTLQEVVTSSVFSGAVEKSTTTTTTTTATIDSQTATGGGVDGYFIALTLFAPGDSATFLDELPSGFTVSEARDVMPPAAPLPSVVA